MPTETVLPERAPSSGAGLQKPTARDRASETFGSPTASIREEPESLAVGKVRWRVGPRRTAFRATATETSPILAAGASGLRVRTDAAPNDTPICGVVQRNRHLTSTLYRWMRRSHTAQEPSQNATPD